MEIISISINEIKLILGSRKNNTTSWYEVFMEYCIAHHRQSILSGGWLTQKFSLNSEDPAFGKAVKWKRVKSYNGVYYHNYIDNRGKFNVVDRIGKELKLNFKVIIRQEEIR